MNTEKDTIIQAFEILSKFEKKARPFRYYYKDFPIWLALRQSVYLLILKNLTSSQDINCGSFTRRKRIWTYIPLLISEAKFINRSIILNSKKIREKYILCSEDVYRKPINEEEVNIFIDPIRKFDKYNEAIGIEFITNSSSKKNEMFYTLRAYDLFLLRAISYILKPLIIKILKKSFSFSEETESELMKIGIESKTLRYLTDSFISDFEFVTRYWEYVIRNTKPKLIATIGGYSVGNMLMIFTANKKGIPTVELSHGLVTPCHVGYIYKNLNNDLKNQYAFSKYLIVFGKNFKDILIKEGTLWKKESIINLGYPWLDYYLNNVKINKNILRIKLGIGKEIKILTITSSSEEPFQSILVKLLLDVKIPSNWVIVIKLHPNEISLWKNKYVKIRNKSNIKFVTDKEIGLYDLLQISEAHASLISTVLWEASVFGLSNYIIDCSTKYQVKEIEELGLAKVSKIQDIFTDNFKPNKKRINYIFSNLDGSSSQKVWEFIKKISYKGNAEIR